MRKWPWPDWLRSYRAFIAFLLICLIWLVGHSFYIYEVKVHRHAEEGKGPAPFENLVVDLTHSFTGHDPEQVICYRESHRNFYIFTFILLGCIAGLIALGLGNQIRLSRNLRRKNEEIERQQKELKKANDNLISSIRYASFIQERFQPDTQFLNRHFPRFGLINLPRDMVSGDFLFVRDLGNELVVAVGDCTGHGVPGALLTVHCQNRIAQALESGIHRPDLVLNYLNARLSEDFDHPDLQAGMDLGFCRIDRNAGTLQFAGAHHSLLIRKNGSVEEITGDRKGLGDGKDKIAFTLSETETHPDSVFFMSSDGLRDQFGGPQSRKWGRKRVLELMADPSVQNATEVIQNLESALLSWKGNESQTDDILAFGFQVG